MILYLIRHGQTDINKENRIQGRHGLPLNVTGIKQANSTKEKLKNIKFDFVFSSPQVRAIQTAKIVSGVEPVIDERLNVFDIGEAENLKLDEGVILNDMIPDPTIYKGVEKEKNYIDRIYSFVKDIIKKYKNKDACILVSGHSCTTGCISSYFEGMPKDGNFLKLSVNNAEYKVYEIK